MSAFVDFSYSSIFLCSLANLSCRAIRSCIISINPLVSSCAADGGPSLDDGNLDSMCIRSVFSSGVIAIVET